MLEVLPNSGYRSLIIMFAIIIAIIKYLYVHTQSGFEEPMQAS